ncbi:hypothetical protein E3N88_29609 [Mikania micrantha]|uniref:Uncharacterized protein n=1 Tax=Mikania micrantha TaxID=192012 RepID=A0A5N6MJY6_9ASTR|nr:hypothetical protein E3N88_29609 [Mikania micrantha]
MFCSHPFWLKAGSGVDRDLIIACSRLDPEGRLEKAKSICGSARKGSDLVYKTVLGVEKQSCVSYVVLCEQEEKHLCDLGKTYVGKGGTAIRDRIQEQLKAKANGRGLAFDKNDDDEYYYDYSTDEEDYSSGAEEAV